MKLYLLTFLFCSMLCSFYIIIEEKKTTKTLINIEIKIEKE
jgi:hypothetical protein